MPFGEGAVEQNNSMYNNVYKFNAKQLDDETGYYYYGARYYDPKSSLWLSVDPLAEKYPNFSPYTYTFQNPLNFVDPTGMEGTDWYQDKKTLNVRWFNGSGERAGYTNIGKTTNFLAGNQGLQLNSNGTATDLNSGQGYGANMTIKVGNFTVSTISEGHYFAEATINGSVGVQAGVQLTKKASLSAGVLTTDIGTYGYCTETGIINEYGDGTNHNYIEGELSISKKLQVYGKADYIYDHMPQANMKNDSYFDGKLGIGTKLINSPLSGENKKFGGSTTGFIKVGKDEISVDFSAGLKVVLGVEAHVKFGYKF